MDPIDPIDPGLTGLHRAVPAGAFPVLAEGGRVWIRGTATRPGFRIGAGGHTLATVETPALGGAANVLLFPGVVRRDFVGTRRSTVETLLATPDLPMAVIQWTTPPGPVEVRLAEGARPSATVDGNRVTVGDSRVEVILAPFAGDPAVTVDVDLLRIAFEPPEEGVTTLVVAFGSDWVQAGTPEPLRSGARTGREASAASRYLPAARHARAHAVRAARGPDEGLLLSTGIGEVDDGVRWLRARIAGQARRLDEARPRRGLAVGLASIVVGDAEAALAAIRSLHPASPTAGLLTARHAATFGDPGQARRVAHHWVQEGPALGDPGLAALAAEELADALHLAGDPTLIAELRRRAAGFQRETPSGPGARDEGAAERRLPMAGRGQPKAGGDRPRPSKAWWSPLLEGQPESLSRSFATDPDAAWVAWRRLLTDGFEASPGRGPTLWDPPESPDATLTAELLLALCLGLLGLRPDAAVGRLTLAPTLPGHLTSFEVGGIPLGSSAVRLRYAKDGGSVRFEVEPEVATVPPLLVFEPSVTGAVTRVLVDGEPAELDVRRRGERTVVPVQLPLDAPRVVEITVDGRRDGGS